MMQMTIRLALILCLMLTGIGLGMARGTVAVGGQMVLCTGQGVVVIQGAEGHPAGPVHLCPDMALSLLAAVAPPESASVPARGASCAQLEPVGRPCVGMAPPLASARAPPAWPLI